MQVGIPREIKDQEYRVGMAPSSVRELVRHGHTVLVEQAAGIGAGFQDNDYTLAGAKVVANSDEIFASSDMIIKVKELQKEEYAKLRTNQILFTFLHLAADLAQAEKLLASGCIAIAYETVTNTEGGLPLLIPMSEVAGRLSVQVGAHYLEKIQGGRGVLLGGVSGVNPAKVLVLGSGVAGTQAIRVAIGMGADVTVWSKSVEHLQALDNLFDGKITCCYAEREALEENLKTTDLLIGTILVPGAATPKVVSRDLLRQMQPGSVIVDVSIDQGGCTETSRPTSHTNPTYLEEGVVHYCVTNMPAGVPRTSTLALNNATLPFIIALANKGYQACIENPHLLQGLNIYKGHMTHPVVAAALGKIYTPPLPLLNS